MLNKLPPRERQIVDLLFEQGEMAVSDLCDALPDRLSGSAVRAMLKRLEDKGFVRRTESERGFLFSPTMSDAAASKTALVERGEDLFQRLGGERGDRAARHVRHARHA